MHNSVAFGWKVVDLQIGFCLTGGITRLFLGQWKRKKVYWRKERGASLHFNFHGWFCFLFPVWQRIDQKTWHWHLTLISKPPFNFIKTWVRVWFLFLFFYCTASSLLLIKSWVTDLQHLQQQVHISGKTKAEGKSSFDEWQINFTILCTVLGK